LLTVSVYFNYTFFVSHSEMRSKWITLLLCVLLDVSVIKFVGLAHDKRMLNYSGSENIETHGLLYMIAFNILFKLRLKTLKAYKANVKTLKHEVLKEDDVKTTIPESIEPVKRDNSELLKEIVLSSESIENSDINEMLKETELSKDNVVSLNKRVLSVETDVKTENVKSYLVKTYKASDLVDVKTLKESFDLTARDWQKIKKDLPELITKGTNTYFMPNDELQNLV